MDNAQLNHGDLAGHARSHARTSLTQPAAAAQPPSARRPEAGVGDEHRLIHRVDDPRFRFDAEITSVLRAWQEARAHRAHVLAQVQAALTPTEAEQRMRHTLARHAADASGVEPGLVHRVHNQQMRKVQVVRRLVSDSPKQVTPRRTLSLKAPAPSGAYLRWVRTEWEHTDHFRAAITADGLVFTGGPTGSPPDDWLGTPELIHARLGAAALFQIPPEILRPSPAGGWSSEPSLVIYGGLLAGTGGGGLPGADSVTTCVLHLEHQLFQCQPGPNGTVSRLLGEAYAIDRLVDEVNTGHAMPRRLPGQARLPSVSLTELDPTRALWARVEVRIDVRVQGAGSFLWCDPGVRVTPLPWPLRPTA